MTAASAATGSALIVLLAPAEVVLCAKAGWADKSPTPRLRQPDIP